MKLRVVIADDEALGRERLRRFLRAEPGAEVVAECADGKEALNAIRRQSPDLVFLDVKMPELDGFGVVEALQGDPHPAIIFVTAYDRFAVRAFEISAVDYLLKPFDQHRFQTALHRARERLRSGRAREIPPSIAELRVALASSPPGLERLVVKSQGRITFVNASDIDWVGAADNYVEVHVGNATHLLRMTIAGMISQFPPNRFARISRSVVVNLERVKELHPRSHGDYAVLLRNGTCLGGTRNYRGAVAGMLGKYR